MLSDNSFLIEGVLKLKRRKTRHLIGVVFIFAVIGFLLITVLNRHGKETGTMREVQDTQSSWLESVSAQSAGPDESIMDFRYDLLFEKEDFIVFQCNYILYGYDLTNKTTTFCIDMLKATNADSRSLEGGSSKGIRAFFNREESKILLVLNHEEAAMDANQEVTGMNEVVEATCLIDFQKRNILKQSDTITGQDAVYMVSQQIAPLYETLSGFQGFLGFENDNMKTGNLYYQNETDIWYLFR